MGYSMPPRKKEKEKEKEKAPKETLKYCSCLSFLSRSMRQTCPSLPSFSHKTGTARYPFLAETTIGENVVIDLVIGINVHCDSSMKSLKHACLLMISGLCVFGERCMQLGSSNG